MLNEVSLYCKTSLDMSVSHALFIYIYVPSLPTGYTHKVEEVTTLTPDSPPCMVTPTTANIHELKAVRLVAYICM